MIHIVCGPPCSGKSTYIAERRGQGELVVDHDAYARAAGSPVEHGHKQRYRDLAEARVGSVLRRIERGEVADAWVIRSYPRAADRVAVAQRLGVDQVVLVMPSIEVCRIRAAGRRNARHTLALIEWWYRTYEPAAVDYLVAGAGV